ncbi:uncharacterized protein TNCT_33841 [Trichonephila clavata]|uniref:Peptidase aspartic putative domain-containing protein n=1 Tax=Trichonephila clavata TaxID=2740835 RepID=A0A8X6FND9_TRICU|nr:uncharacterized protein TNCT_33841 [Trichonephila clavata]
MEMSLYKLSLQHNTKTTLTDKGRHPEDPHELPSEQKHHTLLHKYSTPSTNYKTDLETLGPDLNSSQIVGNSEPDSSSENARVSFHTNGNNSILINTAIVYVRDSEGIRQPLRAILDCASESSFISSRSAEALGLQKGKDFYMDDCLSGSSELTEFETLQMELKQLLQRGGMTLHKWCTNLSSTNAKEFPLDRNSEEIQVKTLGMIWNSLHYKCCNTNIHIREHSIIARLQNHNDFYESLKPSMLWNMIHSR